LSRISEEEKTRRFAKAEMIRLIQLYRVIPEDDTLEEAHWWSTILLALNTER